MLYSQIENEDFTKWAPLPVSVPNNIRQAFCLAQELLLHQTQRIGT